MGPLGGPELIAVLIIVLLLFGAKRLPDLGRSLGSGMREFKGAITGKDRDDDEPDRTALSEESAPTPATEASSREREDAAHPRA